jgi:nucleotide-binding universal stress UspA family protein
VRCVARSGHRAPPASTSLPPGTASANGERQASAGAAEEVNMSSKGCRFVTVVGIDFSPMSIRALDEALEITSLRGGEVHVVYVDHELPPDLLWAASTGQPFDADASLAKVHQHAEERVQAAVARSGALSMTRVVTYVRRGSPAQQIADLAASLDADLVVVGSHGRHGVERFLLGSVAERVVRLARCPVWVVRSKDHAAELKVPEIEPPCPDCLARRAATGGTELWCGRHAEHHLRPHRYSYVQNNGLCAPETASYEATPER